MALYKNKSPHMLCVIPYKLFLLNWQSSQIFIFSFGRIMELNLSTIESVA